VAGLYVLGGRQRKSSLTQTAPEEALYESALILEIDPETQESKVCVEYKSPPEVRASAESSILFKAGTLEGDNLYTCTSTEVLVYELPEFKLQCYVSLPCFNDLHHVCPTADGHLVVANTGLDMVVEFTCQGEVLRQWNVLGEDVWGRFSPDIDYRKVASTKPHRSHPSYVFRLGPDIWVTRHRQSDVLCLTRHDARINVGLEKMHDGHVEGDRIYFTTVDGNVVIVDRNTLQVTEVVDLKQIDNERRALLGWCRGLMIVDQTKFWVGFTRVRKTKFMENINWVKHVFRDFDKPTHITLYDISARKILREIDLEPHGINVVFSIFQAPESTGNSGSR
jgi:hypothetical protein